MLANLNLESIGDNTYQTMQLGRAQLNEAVPGLGDRLCAWPRPCRVVDVCCHRELRGKRDYSRANSRGSRGIYVHYLLESGHLYWVTSKTSWRCTETYYCAVTDTGDINRVDKGDVPKWLNAHSA